MVPTISVVGLRRAVLLTKERNNSASRLVWTGVASDPSMIKKPCLCVISKVLFPERAYMPIMLSPFTLVAERTGRNFPFLTKLIPPFTI